MKTGFNKKNRSLKFFRDDKKNILKYTTRNCVINRLPTIKEEPHSDDDINKKCKDILTSIGIKS